MKRPDKKENFVGMPIKMFAFGHEGLFVTKKDENAFILYYLLDTMTRNIYTWGSVETSVSLLSKKLPIKTKESDNRAEIKRLLLSLFNKGFIKIYFDEESFENDTLLTIRMLELDDAHIMGVVDSDKYKHTGWVAVTEEMFKACKGNARHLRMMIYTEWRMFRGQQNEGTYRISYGEWERVLDISHPTAVSLIKEVEKLNLIDKFRGAMYTDASGNLKQETNLYAPVTEEQREERKAGDKAKETDSFAKKHNTEVLALVNEMEVTDPRTEKTNLFNPSKKVYLNPYCWYVWQTTDCKITKKQGDKRFEAFKKANPTRYNALVKEGKKEKEKQERAKQAKKSAEVYTEMLLKSGRPDFDEFEEEGRNRYSEAKARREAIEAQEKAEKDARRIKSDSNDYKKDGFANRVRMQLEARLLEEMHNYEVEGLENEVEEVLPF